MQSKTVGKHFFKYNAAPGVIAKIPVITSTQDISVRETKGTGQADRKIRYIQGFIGGKTLTAYCHCEE